MLTRKGFQTLLYRHLIMGEKHAVKIVAPAIDAAPTTLYRYAEGELTFPPDLIGPLYMAIKEREFIDYILERTDLQAVPRAAAARDERSLELETLDVAAFVGQLSTEIGKAVTDGHIDAREARAIEDTVNRLVSEIEQVRLKARAGN